MNDVYGRALGERIRTELENRIVSGEWPPGYPIPSEHDLVAVYSCSRMTMNKSAIRPAACWIRHRNR